MSYPGFARPLVLIGLIAAVAVIIVVSMALLPTSFTAETKAHAIQREPNGSMKFEYFVSGVRQVGSERDPNDEYVVGSLYTAYYDPQNPQFFQIGASWPRIALVATGGVGVSALLILSNFFSTHLRKKLQKSGPG
jgi:hypothetical protein